MLRRDFIMVQIEELGKVIAQLITARKNNAARAVPQLIQTVYDSFALDSNSILTLPPEELLLKLDQNDKGGIQRLEIAVKALIEESYLYPDRQQTMLARAKELLLFIQQRDTTFSLERIAIIENIDSLLQSIHKSHE